MAFHCVSEFLYGLTRAGGRNRGEVQEATLSSLWAAQCSKSGAAVSGATWENLIPALPCSFSLGIKKEPNRFFVPRTVMIGGKVSPSLWRWRGRFL